MILLALVSFTMLVKWPAGALAACFDEDWLYRIPITLYSAQVRASSTLQASGLKGCKATLKCSDVPADIDGDSDDETVFTLVSEGQCGSGAEEASRTVEVRAR